MARTIICGCGGTGGRLARISQRFASDDAVVDETQVFDREIREAREDRSDISFDDAEPAGNGGAELLLRHCGDPDGVVELLKIWPLFVDDGDPTVDIATLDRPTDGEPTTRPAMIGSVAVPGE